MKSFKATDIGRYRQMNEDFVFTQDSSLGTLDNLYLLADGMGGHSGGEIASRFVVEHMISYIREDGGENVVSVFNAAVDSANRRGDAIIDEAKAQASSMIKRAETEIEQDRLRAVSEVRKELGGMAVDLASQMVGREINPADQDSLVDEFIRNAGEKA